MADITTPSDCRRLVEHFYTKVRTDALLGPIFALRIADDEWPEHLDTMSRFWSSILFGLPLYHGNPAVAHMGLAVDDRHFSRWLALWHETVTELFEGPAAEDVIARANRIALVLARRIAEAS